jgi:hypothetical protein
MESPLIVRIGPREWYVTVITDGSIGLTKYGSDEEVFLEFASTDVALDFVSEVAEAARWHLHDKGKPALTPVDDQPRLAIAEAAR